MEIRKKEVKSILTKSPVHNGYTANPYAGCVHNCLYCYAKYLPDWTGHEGERWGEYVDVKYWPPLTEKQKKGLHGKSIFISSATDPYQDLEAEFGRTHALLEELRGTGAEILVVTKSCNVVWDAAILKDLNATVALSINTLDERGEEMKETTLYICEICGERYADRKEAETCEAAHIKPKKLTKTMKFHPYKSGKNPTLTRYEASQYPDWIDIEMQDGSVVRYKR